MSRPNFSWGDGYGHAFPRDPAKLSPDLPRPDVVFQKDDAAKKRQTRDFNRRHGAIELRDLFSGRRNVAELYNETDGISCIIPQISVCQPRSLFRARAQTRSKDSTRRNHHKASSTIRVPAQTLTAYPTRLPGSGGVRSHLKDWNL
ncbi:hypothetical protein MRX96_037897 [Rhipicephalus microplus]